MSYSVTLISNGKTLYQNNTTANIHNPVVQLANIPLAYPTEAQQFTITISAKPADKRSFSFQIFESYEILSEDISNFNIETKDECKLYENCYLTSEYVCNSEGKGCIPSKEAVGIIQEYTINGIRITADGKSFNFNDEAKKNYAKKEMSNAWFYINRNYFCQEALADRIFSPSDLASALGVVGSVDFKDGVFSYTDNGATYNFTYEDEFASCTVPLCTVETSYITTEAFTDGTLRNEGEPKNYLIKEVRSCNILEGGNMECPRYPKDEAHFAELIPCSCSSTALMTNTAEALATINLINKVLENLTCSSQISK
jgi:hypothetical protein